VSVVQHGRWNLAKRIITAQHQKRRGIFEVLHISSGYKYDPVENLISYLQKIIFMRNAVFVKTLWKTMVSELDCRVVSVQIV